MYHHPENKKHIRSPDSQYGIRHVQCFMVFLCVVISFSLRFNLSVAIVSMTQKNSPNSDFPQLEWSEAMKGVVLSAFVWGFPLLQIPGGQLAEKFGAKFLLITSVSFSGVLAILTPFAVTIDGAGYHLMILIRIVQGLSKGFLWPSTNCLLSRWTPVSERGRLVNFVCSGDRFGTFLCMTLSGLLADSRWGWPSIFYLTGGVAILWALIFYYLGADSPQLHTSISQPEKDYILSSLPNTSFERSAMKTPWKAIWTSKPVWALVFTHFGLQWGVVTFYMGTPSYINGVFNYDIKTSGFLSAFPHLAGFFVGFGFAAVNDVIINQEMLSKTRLRKIWSSVTCLGLAFGLCALAFVGANEVLAMSSLVVAVILSSSSSLGLFSNPLDLSPNFAGTLIGISTSLSCIGGTISALLQGSIVTDTASLPQWQTVFLIGATVLFAANLIFIVFGSAKVQSWNDPTKKTHSHTFVLDSKRTVP